MGPPKLNPSHLTVGMRVVITAFDDIPEHEFEILEVYEDCVSGFALSGPLAGEYGEPDIETILRILPD